MTDTPFLIGHAFPLKQTSPDSVHEKTGEAMNLQLFATKTNIIRNRVIQLMDGFARNRLFLIKNRFLTVYHNHVYGLPVNPPGSFGERVRSRFERGGSCFISIRPYSPEQPTRHATYIGALSNHPSSFPSITEIFQTTAC